MTYTDKKCNTCQKTYIVIEGLDPPEPRYTCTLCAVRKARIQHTQKKLNKLSNLIKQIGHKPYTLDEIDEKIEEISKTIQPHLTST